MLTPTSKPTASEAMDFVVYDPEKARLDFDIQQLAERRSGIGLSLPSALRAHLSANWDSYFKILLAGLLCLAAAGLGKSIENHYCNGPECRENNR